MAELLDAVLHCEEVVSESHNWRLQEDVMRALSTLPRCFPLDVVNIRVVPLVFKKIHVAVILSSFHHHCHHHHHRLLLYHHVYYVVFVTLFVVLLCQDICLPATTASQLLKSVFFKFVYIKKNKKQAVQCSV